MNGRYEEDEPLRRRSVPSSSLTRRRRHTDTARVTRKYSHGGGESSLQQQSMRHPPHHHQQHPVVRGDDSFDEYGSIGSLQLSQHDYRAETRPTDPRCIPRYIEFDASSKWTTRLNNVEQGFLFLLQKQSERNREGKPTTHIIVKERYPTLQRYTSDEALPLLQHSLNGKQEAETRNFTELYTIPVQQRREATPKWTPLASQQATTSTLGETPTTMPLIDRVKDLEAQLKVNLLKNAKLDESQALHTARQSKQRASRKLGEMLAKAAPRQESTTTFATDHPFMGSLFANSSNTALGVELETVSQNHIDDDEDEEEERAALQRLKESGDLSNSLKAFLSEFQAQQSSSAGKKENAVSKQGNLLFSVHYCTWLTANWDAVKYETCKQVYAVWRKPQQYNCKKAVR